MPKTQRNFFADVNKFRHKKHRTRIGMPTTTTSKACPLHDFGRKRKCREGDCHRVPYSKRLTAAGQARSAGQAAAGTSEGFDAAVAAAAEASAAQRAAQRSAGSSDWPVDSEEESELEDDVPSSSNEADLPAYRAEKRARRESLASEPPRKNDKKL